jgi:hypothetical protein
MRGILRLIEGLLNGDPFAIYVLIFAVAGTAIIYGITEVVQRRRRAAKKDSQNNPNRKG